MSAIGHNSVYCLSSGKQREQVFIWSRHAENFSNADSFVSPMAIPNRCLLDRLPADWGGTGYKNVWLGTGAELKKYLFRLDDLRKIPCVLRWLDFAPMLEDLMPELAEHIDGFGWVNASGETGCNYVDPRPFDLQWARNVRDLCFSKGIPFWFSHVAGRERYPDRLLDGVTHNGIPLLDRE